VYESLFGYIFLQLVISELLLLQLIVNLVGEERLELSQYCYHWILSFLRPSVLPPLLVNLHTNLLV